MAHILAVYCVQVYRYRPLLTTSNSYAVSWTPKKKNKHIYAHKAHRHTYILCIIHRCSLSSTKSKSYVVSWTLISIKGVTL